MTRHPAEIAATVGTPSCDGRGGGCGDAGAAISASVGTKPNLRRVMGFTRAAVRQSTEQQTTGDGIVRVSDCIRSDCAAVPTDDPMEQTFKHGI